MENISGWLPQTTLLVLFGLGGIHTLRTKGTIIDYLLGLGMILGLLWWGGFFG